MLEDQSALAPPDACEAALEGAGFEVIDWIDRTAFAKHFFVDLAAAQSRASGPPPLGLHLVVSHGTTRKVGRMVSHIEGGLTPRLTHEACHGGLMS